MLVTNHIDGHTVTATLSSTCVVAERSVNVCVCVWCHNYGLWPGVSPLICVCISLWTAMTVCFVYRRSCINRGERWGHVAGRTDTDACFGLILSLFQQSTWLKTPFSFNLETSQPILVKTIASKSSGQLSECCCVTGNVTNKDIRGGNVCSSDCSSCTSCLDHI